MDFFEAQDRAKRNTGKLVFLYVMAVAGIIFSVYLVSIFLFHSQNGNFEGSVLEAMWNPVFLVIVSVIVLTVIALGTAFRIAQLRKGGSAVAQMLGGRKLEPSTAEPAERQLMNVVEEMSIASGLPVPDVYVLDKEENINAFAAGLTTHDAAVGVTRGTLEQLTRDELQGVIAHEFSHIFNGDMRLNIRLIGILNGILVIHVMGMIVIRSMMFSGGGRRRNKDGKGGGIAIVLFGVALIIIGYIGMLFGRMIQSAISRQREYLADAAAVQYTRNPDGLAGALTKISQAKKGAEIKDGHAMEMSHLFFASSFHSALDKLYATHPPIEKRIKALNPSLDAADERKRKKIRAQFQKQHVSGSGQAETGTETGGHAALTPEVILAAIGTLDETQVNRTGKLLQEIPGTLRQAAHESLTAEALIYSLLLASDDSFQNIPVWLKNESEEVSREVEKFIEELKKGKRTWFLPLAELSLPALRNISADQYREFRSRIEKLAKESGDDNLFAFALEKIIVRQLDTAFSKTKDPEVRHQNLKKLGSELSILLSALAYLSDEDPGSAWNSAIKPVKGQVPESIKLLPKEQCGLGQLDKALDELAASANPVKKYVMSAVIHCMVSDRKITTEEKELLRAISETMDIPIPMGI